VTNQYVVIILRTNVHYFIDNLCLWSQSMWLQHITFQILFMSGYLWIGGGGGAYVRVTFWTSLFSYRNGNVKTFSNQDAPLHRSSCKAFDPAEHLNSWKCHDSSALLYLLFLVCRNTFQMILFGRGVVIRHSVLRLYYWWNYTKEIFFQQTLLHIPSISTPLIY
jgi:hypothetical protein